MPFGVASLQRVAFCGGKSNEPVGHHFPPAFCFRNIVIADIDIWPAAQQMWKLYGPDAAIHAAMRGDQLMDKGDAAAINELERAPRDGESRP